MPSKEVVVWVWTLVVVVMNLVIGDLVFGVQQILMTEEVFYNILQFIFIIYRHI